MIDELTSFSPIHTLPFDYVELFHKGKVVTIYEGDLPYTIGRDDSSCQLFVDNQEVSRLHCQLMMKDQQFGLLDSSMNGTSIQSGQSNSVMVKETFCPLTGKGAIALGKALFPSDPDLIHYKVVSKKPPG